VIRTHDAAQLEKVMQGILGLRGQRLDSAPGAEWFLTNPSEVLDLYRLIRQDASDGLAALEVNTAPLVQ
jgi:hypothetical protein